MTKSPSRMVIIDECHALSKAAITSLLKSIEEPPANTFWALCTTDASKVPTAIATRCTTYQLNPVHADDIFNLLVRVCEAEKFATPDDVLDLISHKCNGSPRTALSALAKCFDCKDVKEAATLLQTALDDEQSEAFQLCQLLQSGNATWQSATKLVSSLKDVQPESVRQVMLAYFTKVAMNSYGDKAKRAIAVLDAFSRPCVNVNTHADTLLSLADLLLRD